MTDPDLFEQDPTLPVITACEGSSTRPYSPSRSSASAHLLSVL
jgi:hypothetical protein